MDIDTQFDKYICCAKCRERHRRKRNGVLGHGFMKYLIDQAEFLREETKPKKKFDHIKNKWIKMFKLLKALIKFIAKLFSTTTAHKDQNT